MTRYKQLLAQRAKLDEEINAARTKAMRYAIDTCRALIDEFGLAPIDLGFVKTQQIPPKKVAKAERTFTPPKPKREQPPKYQCPDTGKTWSGRGHTPHWIVGNRDDYLIKEPKPLKRVTQNNKHEHEHEHEHAHEQELH